MIEETVEIETRSLKTVRQFCVENRENYIIQENRRRRGKAGEKKACGGSRI